MNQIYNDPFESASNPQTSSGELWGQVKIDAWYCVLEKGYGRAPFDPQQHELSQRRTAIDITIEPLPELGITNENVCQRRMLAESKEWRTITLQSLHDLGIQDVRQINGKWARIHPEPTGRTYEKDGQTKQETMFKFAALFESEEACRKDYLAESGQPSPTEQPAVENDGDLARETAKAFLNVIVSNAINGKPAEQWRAAVSEAIAGFPGVSKYFTFDSPEVQELLPVKKPA